MGLEVGDAAGVSGRIWAGAMIAPRSDLGQGGPASFVERTFVAPGAGKMVLHVSAQGLYRCFLNGRRVGEDLLTPGLTCYDQRLAYQSYDVTDLLIPGENDIRIWLADGWFRSQIMWASSPIFNCWGDRIGAIADLERDGRVVLSTDERWRSGVLPIQRSGIYFGEDYDARLEAVAATEGVEALAFDTKRLVPHEASPVREMAPFDPVATWTEDDGGQVFDFGQNAAGYVRFSVRGARGAVVRVEHAEVLGPDRFFDNRNYRSARAEILYTLKGDGVEVFAPYFTFMGFRYARVTITGTAELLSIVSVPISSVPVAAGGFETGEPAVDRLVLNTIWSQRSNFIEIPTDCPQRDERLGWTGDAQVFAGTACWLADSERFLAKYLRDVVADQRADGAVSHFSPDPTRLHVVPRAEWAGSTGWGDAITVIPWQLYLHYGRVDVLRECFPAMLRWLDYLWSLGDGPIPMTASAWGARGFTFGDWLQPIGDNRKPRPTIADDCAATLYHAISTDIAARVAVILGETAEADRLRDRLTKIRAAFAREYISASGRLAHNDQTSYALAVLYDLIPPEHRAAAKAYFRKAVIDTDYLIGTGFIGTPALLPALSKLGLDDLAEKVFLNRRVPGWLYQVDKGATTIWERWDAIAPDGTIYEPLMNSYNHYAYGAVCQWLFETVAGVAPTAAAPGFDEVTIAPSILPALGHVAMWHQCRHGRIDAGWHLKGTTVTYVVTLPDGCRGRLMPNLRRGDVRLDGHAVTIATEGLPLSSGRHDVVFDLKS